MDRSTYLLGQLLDELQKLNPIVTGSTEPPVAARISLRAGNGHLVGGDALLCEKALDALLDAVRSLNAYAQHAGPDREQDIDPLLEADFEESCIGFDVDHLMSLAVQDPHRAVAEFDQVTADEDGEL
jgi:hypothetical protein